MNWLTHHGTGSGDAEAPPGAGGGAEAAGGREGATAPQQSGGARRMPPARNLRPGWSRGVDTGDVPEAGEEFALGTLGTEELTALLADAFDGADLLATACDAGADRQMLDEAATTMIDAALPLLDHLDAEYAAVEACGVQPILIGNYRRSIQRQLETAVVEVRRALTPPDERFDHIETYRHASAMVGGSVSLVLGYVNATRREQITESSIAATIEARHAAVRDLPAPADARPRPGAPGGSQLGGGSCVE